MAKNILVINVDIRETRVALIENGIIAELHLERESNRGTLGNIYLGKVSRVLPGMQAAFIDIGQERAAFLHVEDLIRPDDFDAYLSGHRHKGSGDEERESTGDSEESAESVHADEERAAPESEPDEEEVAELQDAGEPLADDDAATEEAESAPEADSDDEPLLDGDDDAEIGHGSFAEATPEDAPDDEPEELEYADEEAAAEDEPEEDDATEEEDEATEDEDAAQDEDEEAAEDEDQDQDQDEDLAASADEDEDLAAGPDDDGIPASERRPRRSDPALMETKVAAQPIEPPVVDAERAPESPAAAEEEDEEEEEELSASDIEEMDLPRVSIADAPVDGVPAAGGAPRPEDEAGLRAPRARTRRGGRGRRRRGKTRPEGAEETAKVEAPREARPAPPPPPAEKPKGGRGEGGRGDRSGRDGGRGGREAQGRSRDGDKRGRRDGRRPDGRRGASAPAERRQGRAKDPLRVSKSTPIRDVVREGQEVIVQVSKEPIGTKGARVTSHISLPGRYAVYLPTVEHIGISKRIGSDKERARLREAIEAMKPPQGGLIVRTLAEGLTKKSLKADVGYLVRLWGEIVSRRETTERAPNLLYSELDLVLKTARDLFTDDIEKIVIDSREAYTRLRRFVEIFMPDRVNAIELYEGEEPIFDAYGIEDEIGRALSRKVPLTSGGHLIIDQAEALTAIDVNTGRFVGRGSRDLEDTILQTNLEAVEEIAYQLRFRNIGGLIILDLIDMERISNREKVRRKLEQLLAKDKAKTTLNRISDLGLIEMTRKRTRESLGRIMNEPCFYCDGTGNLQSRQTIAYEILRQIKRERMSLRGYSVVVNAHPAVIDFLRNEERAAVIEAERRYMRRVELVPRKEYHLEQFDLAGK